MTEKTITRADLIDALVKEVSLPRQDCGMMLETVLGLIEAKLVAGETVKLARFGNFTVRSKDDAPATETSDAPVLQTGLDVAFAADQFEQSQLKTHEMQVALARAVEAGEFDGGESVRRAPGEAALLNVLALLENAKTELDHVRRQG
jgi:nucleoid DNA-binding protein